MRFASGVEGHKAAHHGGPYSVQDRDAKISDFSSNVNPLGCPPAVHRMLKSKLKEVTVYPDPDSGKLKGQLAKYLGVPADNLVVGNGATEIIYNFSRATVDRGTPVLIPSPTFGEYEAASNMCGGRLIFFKTVNLQNDADEFIRRIPRSGVVFVCNPNNPTGSFVPKKTMLSIVDAASKKNTHVLVDECFVELTSNPEQSLTDRVAEYGNLLVLRSLTKSFGLAGLRIGYAIANRKTSTILNRIKIPWNVNALAQEAGCIALSDRKFLARTQELINAECEFLKRSISKIGGFECHDSKTNFILIKTRMGSKTLQKRLLEKKILVRDCSTFRGLDRNHIRVAVRTRRENLRLIRALEDVS